MCQTCSNNGGEAITEKTMENWNRGLPREQLRLFDMEQILTLRAFNEKGQLYSYLLLYIKTKKEMYLV